MIAPEPIKRRIPVGGWILFLTFICVAGLLLLPNGKQKRVTLARKKLETDYKLTAGTSRILEVIQGERVVLPGRRSGFLIWHFWSPKKAADVQTSLLTIPEFARASRASSAPPMMKFSHDAIIVAPLNDPAATTFARAFLVWGNNKDWSTRLDQWRLKYPSNSAAVLATIESELKKVPAERMAKADASLAQTRAAVAAIEDGTEVFVDSSGRRFEVKRGLEWDFQNQYEMADLANRQAGR